MIPVAFRGPLPLRVCADASFITAETRTRSEPHLPFARLHTDLVIMDWASKRMADYDVVVIGGGPAGLTAAIYLARFHLRTIILDAGQGRALMIPVSHNHAGHPAGISGRALVDRMRIQAIEYGARLIEAEASKITIEAENFRVFADTSLQARAVLLATGVHNNRPSMDDRLHDEAVAGGQLRYCPICDGYEVTDKRIAVIGTGARGAREAIFIRSFSPDVTLIAEDGVHALDSEQRASLADAGIRLVDGPARDFRLESGQISLSTAAGRLAFDTIYPALGSVVRSGLAAALGATIGDDGCVCVDPHQRTSIAGLYAAGDVVLGLDQISNAMGEAAVAATAIRNDLHGRRPLRR